MQIITTPMGEYIQVSKYNTIHNMNNNTFRAKVIALPINYIHNSLEREVGYQYGSNVVSNTNNIINVGDDIIVYLEGNVPLINIDGEELIYIRYYNIIAKI